MKNLPKFHIKNGKPAHEGLTQGKMPQESGQTQVIGRKKRRLKYIAVLPSFITLMNGACGFMSIVFASRSPALGWTLSFIRRSYLTPFTLAGYFIFLAMLADMLDGRVARLTRTTSSFGGQLDSLSDVISFGIAPAFLMVKMSEFSMEQFSIGSLRFTMLIGRGLFFSAILYSMCAVVRLARFNVENEEDEASHMNFSGLPSPAAAGVVVSIVVLHQQFHQRAMDGASAAFRNLDIVPIFVLPAITLLAGILMVSRVRYPHLPNQILRGKKTPAALLAFFASALLIVWNISLAMVIGFCGFAFFGVIRWIISAASRNKALRAGKTNDSVSSR